MHRVLLKRLARAHAQLPRLAIGSIGLATILVIGIASAHSNAPRNSPVVKSVPTSSPIKSSPSAQSSPMPLNQSTTPTTQYPGPSVAQLTYDCVEYQSQTASALYTTTNALISRTQSAANAAWQQSFPSLSDRTAYINQLYTDANTALHAEYSTYLSGFSPGVPNCRANAVEPTYFNML